MAGIHFLDWRPHNRRAENLAEDLGATLWLAPNRFRRKAFAPLRYGLLSVRTVRILLQTRPDVVIASSPPSLCPILVFAYARISGCKYIIDAHHLATTGFWSRFPFGSNFNNFIMRSATATLVHNQMIEDLARTRGIPAITLETKIPELQAELSGTRTTGTFAILMPCSFDPDEPVAAIYLAATSLPCLTFYVTGDPTRLDAGLRKAAPQNVVLTGFLTQEEYDSLLAGCDVVLATATNDYPVRPRAASEAIAAGKPLIASHNQATKSHLGDAAVLIQNTAGDIVRGLEDIQKNYDYYRDAVKKLKEERRKRYEAELRRLTDLLCVTNHASMNTPVNPS